MPRESLDARNDLPKEPLRQVAFGQLQDVVPGMPDEAPAGLEQPLLETVLPSGMVHDRFRPGVATALQICQ